MEITINWREDFWMSNLTLLLRGLPRFARISFPHSRLSYLHFQFELATIFPMGICLCQDVYIVGQADVLVSPIYYYSAVMIVLHVMEAQTHPSSGCIVMLYSTKQWWHFLLRKNEKNIQLTDTRPPITVQWRTGWRLKRTIGEIQGHSQEYLVDTWHRRCFCFGATLEAAYANNHRTNK